MRARHNNPSPTVSPEAASPASSVVDMSSLLRSHVDESALNGFIQSFKTHDWRLFFQSDSFERPRTMEEANEKAYQNFGIFKYNYFVICFAFVCLSILSNVRAAILTCVGVIVTMGMVTDFRGLATKVKAKKTILYTTAGVYFFCIFFLTNALQLFCLGLVGGTMFSLFHAYFFVAPPFVVVN
jgi:hypothetical protein